MSLSQQEISIATTILEAGILALPIVAILLQYASQSRFAERPEFQGRVSYHTLMLGLSLTVVVPLIVSIIASVLLLGGKEFPLTGYTYLEISLIGIGTAAAATGLLIWNLRRLSERSDTVRSVHREFSYQLLGIDEIAQQLQTPDSVSTGSSEENIDEVFRDYLMWLRREEPEIFEELKEEFGNSNQEQLDDFSEK